ncbi:MAG: Rap1a/Tai family immunity protein [Chlorobiaceae bacterium]
MITGNDLVRVWQEYKKFDAGQPAHEVNVGDYRGYVAGVCDVCNRWLFTTPDGATQGQVCSVVGKWLEEHPNQWTEPAMSLVIQALQEAFPFRREKKRRMQFILFWVSRLTSP